MSGWSKERAALTGTLVISTAGHDKDAVFFIINEDSEYVYLVDGQIRTLENPKKKKKKHVKPLCGEDALSVDRARITDEAIKYAIRCFKRDDQEMKQVVRR